MDNLHNSYQASKNVIVPLRDDIIWVERKDIICKVHEPVPSGKNIPRPVFADLLSYLSPETLNRLSETIHKQNINVESLWCRHYEERWHVVCIEGYSNVKYDEFQHRNDRSVCQVYHQKHLKDIIEWTVNKSSKAHTLDPYAAYRCPSHILKHSRNKMAFFDKIVISDLARKKDNKLIVKHIERFTIRGGMCANILEEKTLIYLLLQYVVHIKIVTITQTSLDGILTLLSIFLKNSKIQSVALCHILVKKSESLEKLLLHCAGNFHNLKYSYCANDHNNSSDQSFQNQRAFGDEIDLLDEALMSDSIYNNLRQNQTQLDRGNSDILKAEDVVDGAVLPNSFTLYEFNNSALLHTLKDTLPKWTHLRKLAIHGIADFEVENQLFDVILPLISWGQLTDLCLEILLHNSLHIACLFHQLITTYSNNDIDNSLGIDNQPLNSFKIGPCNRMYTPEISNSKAEIERFHSMNIPETCNFAKIVTIQTGFFEAVGFIQLLKLLKANHVMESLTLQVFDVDLYNTEERTDNIKLIEIISQSSCMLHTLNLDGNQFYNISVDVWTQLLKQKQLLKELSLSHCKLDQNIVKDQKFIRELVNHPNLQIFNISNNALGTECLDILKPLLNGNGCLKTLDLSSNHLNLVNILDVMKNLAQESTKHKLKHLIVKNCCRHIVGNPNIIRSQILKYSKQVIQNVIGLTDYGPNLRDANLEYVAIM